MTRPFVFALSLGLALPAACDGGEVEAAGSAADAGAPARASAPAASDAFEGVITAVAYDAGQRVTQTLRVKGTRWRLEMDIEDERGALIRTADGRLLSISHDERGYAYLPAYPADPDDGMSFEPTGAAATVAGYPCEYHRIRDADGLLEGDRACITTALGFVGFTPAGPLQPADERAVRQQFGDGFLILELRGSTDAVEYQVTRIERAPQDDALFAPPPGYAPLGQGR